ncbi:MAG: rod shape-determining protein RodA [Bacteroidota bacterium]
MNRKGFDLDWITIFLYMMLAIVGWSTVFAVSYFSYDDALPFLSTAHGKQLIFICVAMVVAVLILFLDLRFIEGISYLLYGLSIFLLLLVFLVGKRVNGALAWLPIFGFSFQPAEVAKIATALALARFMSSIGFSLNNARSLGIAIGIVILPALIVILQNDTGSALVFFSLLIVFYREGLNWLIPALIILLAALAVVTLWLGKPIWICLGLLTLAGISFAFSFNKRSWGRDMMIYLIVTGIMSGYVFSVDFIVDKLPTHQQNRIFVLFNPTIDPQGVGYNVIQSKIAIGSGGLTGKGYKQGEYTKSKFVPMQETDFIYCTVGEELGWLGSSFVLMLFFALIWRIKIMAENSKTKFSRIYGYGIISILFFHILVNVGMTVGLMPVIGIPLPFFSYGGSSFLSFTILIFLMVNLYSFKSSVLGSKL